MKKQGDEVLNQLSRDKPCWLTQGQLETKVPAHGRSSFLDWKTVKTWANAGLNWGRSKLQTSSNWAPQILKFREKESKPTGTAGAANDRRYFSTLRYWRESQSKTFASYRLSQSLIDQGKKRGNKATGSLHKGFWYIISGLCTRGTRLWPQSQHRNAHGSGLEMRSQQPSRFPEKLLTRHLTSLSHNRLFPSTGSQVTSHIMQQEGMIRNFLFR